MTDDMDGVDEFGPADGEEVLPGKRQGKYRMNATSFKPGQVVARGRHKQLKTIEDVRDAARDLCPAALASMKRLLMNPKGDPRAKVAAAELVFTRAWGKPVQTHEDPGRDAFVDFLKGMNERRRLEAAPVVDAVVNEVVKTNGVTALPVWPQSDDETLN